MTEAAFQPNLHAMSSGPLITTQTVRVQNAISRLPGHGSIIGFHLHLWRKVYSTVLQSIKALQAHHAMGITCPCVRIRLLVLTTRGGCWTYVHSSPQCQTRLPHSHCLTVGALHTMCMLIHNNPQLLPNLLCAAHSPVARTSHRPLSFSLHNITHSALAIRNTTIRSHHNLPTTIFHPALPPKHHPPMPISRNMAIVSDRAAMKASTSSGVL